MGNCGGLPTPAPAVRTAIGTPWGGPTYPGGGFMASADDVAALRRLVDEPDDVAPYTDTFLNDMIDGYGSVDAAGARIWREKAGSYTAMVDTTESGSSRKLSDLAKNALAMAQALDGQQTVTNTRRAGTTPIERV